MFHFFAYSVYPEGDRREIEHFSTNVEMILQPLALLPDPRKRGEDDREVEIGFPVALKRSGSSGSGKGSSNSTIRSSTHQNPTIGSSDLLHQYSCEDRFVFLHSRTNGRGRINIRLIRPHLNSLFKPVTLQSDGPKSRCRGGAFVCTNYVFPTSGSSLGPLQRDPLKTSRDRARYFPHWTTFGVRSATIHTCLQCVGRHIDAPGVTSTSRMVAEQRVMTPQNLLHLCYPPYPQTPLTSGDFE